MVFAFRVLYLRDYRYIGWKPELADYYNSLGVTTPRTYPSTNIILLLFRYNKYHFTTFSLQPLVDPLVD